MQRRAFISTVGLGAASIPVLHAAPAAASEGGLVDTNVSLYHWAPRRSWVESATLLVERLRRYGVRSAWTGSFDGVLHSDIAGVNSRLADTCAKEGGGILQPFGSINPTLPDWEDDLRRCHEVHRMAGVRLHPNYHGYTLDDPRFLRLLDLSAQRRLLVQIALQIEDERSHNPALASAPVVPAPLTDALGKFPAARVMLLNGGSRLFGSAPLLQKLATAGAYFEIASLEGVAGIEGLFQRLPKLRLCFGSHAPYFYFEAALLKLQESALSPDQLAAVQYDNARTALALA
ncbi:MAG: amidohydrolase family protein [Verrucomicrobiota bacterium]